MATTREQREAALKLAIQLCYPREREAGSWHQAWVETGEIDPLYPSIPWAGVVAVLDFLAQREAAAVERERERCAAYCDARAVQERRDALRTSDALAGEYGLGAYDQGRVDALHDAAIGIGSRPAPGEGE